MIQTRLANRFPLRAVCIGLALVGSFTMTRADEVDDIRALLGAGKAAEALKKTDQLLASKPTDARLLLQKGIALSSLNRTNEAITVFQKLIETHPEHPGPYNNLAVLYASQGEYEKARQSLELAIRTNPNYATAFQNLGDVYARLAGQAYKKALALDKSDTTLPLKLSVIQNVFEPSVDPRQKAGTAAPAAAAKPAAPTPMPAPVTANAPITAPVVAPPKAPAATTAATPTSPAATAKPAPVAPPPVATAAPASKPATVTAPPPVTAKAPTAAAPAKPEAPKVDSAEQERQAVEKSLRAWAQAWSQRDMQAYYAAYAPDFKGKSASRKAWEADRHARITGKKKITVELSDIQVKVDGGKAQVRFRQNYTSDALSAKSSKTIEMNKSKSGAWQITAENSN